MFSVVKTREREEARRIRRDEGRSIKDIARALGVSKSSVSVWVRDIELSEEQHAALAAVNGLHYRQLRARAVRSERARKRRLLWQQQGRLRAKACDPAYAAGCMLFWAEGDKARNAVRLANSDPEVISYFVAFLRRYFSVEDERLRVMCNLFADHQARQRQIEDFWLETVRLPRSCLCKSIVNRYSRYSQKKRKNKLPYGTCRIAVHSTEIVQALYGSIQELAGFERPEWLDLPI
jgi:transposase-like protein